MSEKSIQPGNILTVVIRDDSPLVFCGDSPSYRSVQVTLTPEQRDLLKLFYVGRSGNVDHFESISRCFLEPLSIGGHNED